MKAKKNLLFALSAIITLAITSCGNSEKKVIDIVKNGVFKGNLNTSVEDLANLFFIEPKYTAFQDVNEDWYVELSGIVNWENFENNFVNAAHEYILFDLYAKEYPYTEIDVDIYKTFIEPDLLPLMAEVVEGKEVVYQFKVNPKINVSELVKETYDGSASNEDFMFFNFFLGNYKFILEDLMPELYAPRKIYYIE